MHWTLVAEMKSGPQAAVRRSVRVKKARPEPATIVKKSVVPFYSKNGFKRSPDIGSAPGGYLFSSSRALNRAIDWVVIEGIDGWREMPKYRHARRGGDLGAEAAQAANIWAADRTINTDAPTSTPYGSFPGSKESATPKLRANRLN
jgi:hypothetical protein